MPTKCIHNGCKIRASYNEPNKIKGLYCATHKKAEMIDIKNKKCKCGTIPIYNEPNETTAICCSKCKTDTMINVKDKKCKEKECTTRPSYNKEGETVGLYCVKHGKEKEMVNVISKKCKCGKSQPNYNEPGETTAICCVKCKTDTMIDLKHTKCKEKECTTRPSYNKEGETVGLYCVKHGKEKRMVNVISKKCKCGKSQPNYNESGETTAICCVKCKTDTMVDIKSKKCKCGKSQPRFNEPNKTIAICCSKCKTDTMEDIISKKCKCGKAQPTYNEQGKTPAICCSDCKTDTMVDVKHKTCKNEWCLTRVKEKYDGYCLYCYMNLFPDKPVARNYKTKEYSVVEYVKTTFFQFDWIADKRVQDGCSRRRPDLLLDLGYQIVMAEIDENQHIDYDCSCENKRIMELSQDLGHRPIVFIRFNPDDYIDKTKNITSCWGLDKKGICGVKKSKKKEWDERLKALGEQIKYWTDPLNKTEKTIEVIQLFYDTE